jgi:transcriptional regulator with XRE-family HTH domain
VTPLRTLIARAIRHWREHRGLTQEELARLAGLSVDTIMRLENVGSRTRDPRVDTLELLAKALRVPAAALVVATPKDVNKLAAWIEEHQ